MLKFYAPQNPQTRHTTKAYCPVCGSVINGVAKEPTKILKPLVCKSTHHINRHPLLCGTDQAVYIST